MYSAFSQARLINLFVFVRIIQVIKNETMDGFIEFLNYISTSLVTVEPEGEQQVKCGRK